ncbi:MAG: AbrB/MazE/SpoVT family DNA-binding domain-containing protein [Clostridia bacterium]|nr:AbrB/MazE/SpoVT family DNA-binding domain-containing protein [Clostridia bacterium]
MKATGIVRRIDDLGRVVIPKEIRRTLKIREGDPLEIFTSNDGEVIFKKYSPMGEMIGFAGDFAAALSGGCSLAVAICDRDRCVAVGGGSKKDLLEKAVTPELEKITEDRRLFINQNGADIFALEGVNQKLCVAAPIIAAGDIVGCVVLLETESNTAATDTDIKLAEIAAQFLSARSE